MIWCSSIPLIWEINPDLSVFGELWNIRWVDLCFLLHLTLWDPTALIVPSILSVFSILGRPV